MNKGNFFKNIQKGKVETFGLGMKKKVSLKRWELAQNSEKQFWKDYSVQNIIGDFENKAKFLVKKWYNFIKINKDTKILQIGCGPKDVINYFDIGKKYSIDPLAEFYKERFDIDYESSHLQQGVGEKIPFKDNYFDIVILANVLDHTHLPEKVLEEVKRVLKNNGIFHFENFVYQKRFIQLAKTWGEIKKILTSEIFNIHHPYMFTVKDIQDILLKKFSIIKEEIGINVLEDIETLHDLKQKKRKSKKLTVKLPAMFGLYGIINYTAICKKLDLPKKP